MPKNRPKARVCLGCKKVFKGRPGSVCPGCGQVGSELVTGKKDSPADGPPPGPKPPVMPPAPNVNVTAGGGGVTADALKRAKLGLKQVGPQKFSPPPRPPKPLPGPTQSSIPLGVRVLLNSVGKSTISNVRLARQCPGFRGYFHLPPRAMNLATVFHNIASGLVNNSHANYNTSYLNRGGELPEASNPLNRYRIDYFEYGWTDLIPGPDWKRWRNSNGADAPTAVQNRLSGFLQADNGRLNASRLIVSETGELFYTPDHYVTFFRYNRLIDEWTQYLSPWARYGSEHWDESVYEIV